MGYSVVKVFLICSGLGHVNRGYESFARECFEALASDPSLQITLVQGGDTSIPGSITVPNLPRDRPWTQQIARWLHFHKTLNDPYTLEQITFFLGLIPQLQQHRPDVVFLSDFTLATLLWHWRRISRLNYKILFSNGAPNGPPFSRMDHVQHLTPTHYQWAIEAGEPPEKHTIIPYGIKVSSRCTPISPDEKQSLRRQLDLPERGTILLSVAALNISHKRLDYLIQEVAALPEPRPHLVMLGQQDAETPQVLELAHSCLGSQGFTVRTVSAEQVSLYYQSADLFILASLQEGFGRVFLEAMAHGLPCLAHDYEVSRFVLTDSDLLGDFQQPGTLGQLLIQACQKSQSLHYQQQQHQSVYDRFSWDSLQSQYIDMIHRCIH